MRVVMPHPWQSVMACILEHAIELRAQHADMLGGRWYRSGRNSAPDARHGHLNGKTLGLVGLPRLPGRSFAAQTRLMNCCAVARSARGQTPMGWTG